MNIKQAKLEIQNTLRAYLSKDELGNYLIPTIRQRPVLLMGPPGIGKTQIMTQIAAETGVGLVAYTITHHTRQSAIGLPFIEHHNYGGKEYAITEYTMSEILASVYSLMEKTGLKEGILFLDEINCVSETLAPMMLQFLQCKTFGNQALPEGWLIVAAGNPPEYNKSVRDFDVVTLDRVKRMDVTEDFAVWKEYARNKGIHGAVISYLDIKKEHFYHIETTVDGLQFATARGWEDLSTILKVYEELKRLLARRTDFNTFIAKVSKAMKDKLMSDTYTAFNGVTATTDGLNSAYVLTGSYSEDALLDVIGHVEAANGAVATILGTKKALRKVTTAVVSDEAKSDLYNMGFYGKFNGTNMIWVPQRHKVGTDEFLLDDNKIYVIAGDDKPIKVVNVGEGILSANDPLQAHDMTQNYLYGQEFGVGVKFNTKMGFVRVA